MNREDLLKKIDEKISQLEKEKSPNELLKRELSKKEIISKDFVISEEKIDKLFDLLKNEINKWNSD